MGMLNDVVNREAKICVVIMECQIMSKNEEELLVEPKRYRLQAIRTNMNTTQAMNRQPSRVKLCNTDRLCAIPNVKYNSCKET